MHKSGGFNFDLCARNAFLEKNTDQKPKMKKTGTTIVGLIAGDFVVLGADTRATADSIVADKNCEKIHYIAPNIYCCGAGTSGDISSVTELISSQLVLHRLATGRQSRAITAVTLLQNHLFRYQGYVSAALVLGGCDLSGPSLYTIHPHGSIDRLPFVTMGSGSLAAMAVFEAYYRLNLELEEAKSLVVRAVSAGIFNDLGSGSNVDLLILGKDGHVESLRNYRTENLRKYRPSIPYAFPKGTTPILRERIRPILAEKDTKLEDIVTITTTVTPIATDSDRMET